MAGARYLAELCRGMPPTAAHLTFSRTYRWLAAAPLTTPARSPSPEGLEFLSLSRALTTAARSVSRPAHCNVVAAPAQAPAASPLHQELSSSSPPGHRLCNLVQVLTAQP